MKKTVLILLVLAFMCQPVMAETDYNVCFSTLDSDGSGEVTESDLIAAFPGGGAAVFAAADTDKDGFLDHGEWEGWKENRGFEDNHEG